MAYTKTLIGDITEKGVYNPNTVKLQEVAAVCDTNFTAIQSMLTDTVGEVTADLVGAMVTGNTETGITVTYQDADNTLDFVVAYGTEAATACVGNDARLSDTRTPSTTLAHAHTASAGDGAVLTGYQATPFASTLTLTQMGIVPPEAPSAWAGTAMAALTGASTFQELLNAISTDIATAGT